MLDTNVWLDWLVFNDAGIAPIKQAVTNGRAAIFISPSCEIELTRVLGYALSGRTLNDAAQATALVQCRAIARSADDNIEPHTIDSLPRCADPDDQMFLELARDCRADLLITKDHDLLALAQHNVRPLPFRIITPADFAKDSLLGITGGLY